MSKQICLLGVLPDILDSGAEGRNDYLDVMKRLGEQYKSRPWGLVWTAAGLQPELEASLDIGGAGYPAFVRASYIDLIIFEMCFWRCVAPEAYYL